MPPCLQEQRVDDDGNDGDQCDPARNDILGTVQEDSHRKTVLDIRVRAHPGSAAARSVVIVADKFPRHFSSPGQLALELQAAKAAIAWQYCWKAERAVASAAASPS